jgi:hypothetical protein
LEEFMADIIVSKSRDVSTMWRGCCGAVEVPCVFFFCEPVRTECEAEWKWDELAYFRARVSEPLLL